MKFEPTNLPGVFQILAEPHLDERGAFTRLYCPQEFADAGIEFSASQVNLSSNIAIHTLRGMHWQDGPHAEAKLVRCVRGRAWDVVADIRPQSATRGEWVAFELNAQSANALFIPEGYAHGFLTLEPDTDVLYQMGNSYEPGHARGFRYDDPAFEIAWPIRPAIISDTDLNWPPFKF